MTRHVPAFVAAALALAAGSTAAQHTDGGTSANLRNARGQVVGAAVFWPRGHAISVSVTVRGFAGGSYGMHLHQAGRCEGPDFTSAGPHWNPAGRQHGRLNPHGPHQGDLPNLVVGADGTARIEFDLRVPTGTRAHLNPLLDVDGTSLVIHSSADDERTDPSGNSGARIACGVLRPVR